MAQQLVKTEAESLSENKLLQGTKAKKLPRIPDKKEENCKNENNRSKQGIYMQGTTTCQEPERIEADRKKQKE